ncbi:MAG TPA: N-acetyl sugar amidotransferase [bacterium (Candidatus Stahlbacteria)]|nr:N-acetyl sugar amidotransferase [Candidatus Stahlbacteria bacterium]
MKRCNRCILPETFPDIKFDEDGVCNKCHEHSTKYLNRDYEKLQAELGKIFDWAKNQKKRYDCIVPFSGGKDSSYTLYLCREKYGLKVLAVNFNNGFRTVAALKNIEKIIKKTDVSYICYGPNWNLLQKLYSTFLRKTGKFCFPCDMGIWATVHRIAEKEDVPLIVSGFSTQIESLGPKIYSYNNTFFKNVIQGLITTDEAAYFLEETKLQKVKRRLKHLRLTRYRRQISLPDYMVWDDEEIKHTITRELGWEGTEDGSTDHIDCLFAPIKNYLVVKKWGFGEKTTKYSAMIRAGQITREDALERIASEESGEEPAQMKVFLEVLNLTREDIEQARYKDHLDFF